MRNTRLTLLAAAFLVVVALPAEAYIGPGAGAGAIAVVLGILGSIVMAFIAILWYPFKRLLKKRKKKGPELESNAAGRNDLNSAD